MKIRLQKRLLIGVSSPLGYYYIREGDFGRPAPILESPLSYYLFYDELWFLSRKICPYNMENLDFVHFVDEELLKEGLPQDAFQDVQKIDYGKFPWESWKTSIANTIGLRWRYDNHARGIKFGELNLLPTPGRFENLLVDRYIATTFDMDLVENSVNTIWSEDFDRTQLQLNLSEKLLTSSVTSLQTIDGPWHPAIYDLRGDNLLKQYRSKIQSVSVEDLNQIDQRVSELSEEFENITKKIVAEHFDTTGHYKSALKYVIGLIPTLGTIFGGGDLLLETYNKIKTRREDGWVGFLGKAQNKLEG